MADKIVIIGAGVMGVRLACHFVRAGLQVAVIDPSSESIDKAKSYLDKTGLEKADLTFAANVSVLPESWRHSDLIIEAVPEKIEIKRAVISELEAWFSEHTLIASNSSGLTTAQLAVGMRHPDRLAIAHFFNPADVIPVVELIGAERMPSERLQKLADILRRSGKIPAILHKEVQGFVANRIQHAMMREAFHLLEDGVADADAIDDIVRWAVGVRLAFFGPFLQRDLNGLDTHLSIASYLYPDLSAAQVPADTLRDKVAAGKVGRKAGEGFYTWDKTREAETQDKEQALASLIAANLKKAEE